MGGGLIVPGAMPEHRHATLLGPDGRQLLVVEQRPVIRARVVRLDTDGNPIAGSGQDLPIESMCTTYRSGSGRDVPCIPPVDTTKTSHADLELTYVGGRWVARPRPRYRL